MRVSPIGWLSNFRNIVNYAEDQANVSHNHPEAVKASRALAISMHLALNGMSKMMIKEFIEKKYGYNLDPNKCLTPIAAKDASSQGTLPVALSAALHKNSFEKAIRSVVVLGGDTDTIACMCGALSECFHGVPYEISSKVMEYLPPQLSEVVYNFQKAIADKKL